MMYLNMRNGIEIVVQSDIIKVIREYDLRGDEKMYKQFAVSSEEVSKNIDKYLDVVSGGRPIFIKHKDNYVLIRTLFTPSMCKLKTIF